MSFHVTLNAPTSFTEDDGSGQITYLEYGKLYGISIVDTSAYLHSTSYTEYYTTVHLFCQGMQCQAKCLRDEEHGHDLQMVSKCSGLPILQYMPHTEISSYSSSGLRAKVHDKISHSFSVAWTSNTITGGRHCLIQMAFLESSSCEQRCPRNLLTIRAATQRFTTPNSEKSLDQNFEDCFAQVQMVQPEEATSKILGEFESFHQSVHRVENLLRLLAADIENLQKRWSRSSIPDQQRRNFQAQYGSEPPQQSQCFEREATDKYQDMAVIQPKITHMQAVLSSVQPVTIFRHHTIRECPRNIADGSVELHHGSNPSRLWEESATCFPPYEPAAEAASIAFGLLRSSTRFMSIDGDSHRRCSEQNRLQNWLNTLESTYNEIRSSKRIDIALQEEGSSQQSAITGPNIRIGADRAAFREADGRNFCFYIRVNDDDRSYHRALYLHERTMDVLIKAIQQKFPIARERKFVLYFLDSKGMRVLLDTDVLSNLSEGQDFVMEFDSSVKQNISPSPSQPDSGFFSPTQPETLGRQSVEDYFDFESFLTDNPHHIYHKLPESDTNTASINELNGPDLTNGFLKSPDIISESQSCAYRAYTPPTEGQNLLQLPLLELQGSLHKSMPEELGFKLAPKASQETKFNDTLNPNVDRSKSDLTSETGKRSTRKSLAEKSKSASDETKLNTNEKQTAANKKGKTRKARRTFGQTPETRQNMLEKNRLTALGCRARKKQSESDQCDKLNKKKQDNAMLLNIVAKLRTEARLMTTMLEEHENCFNTLDE